MNKQQLKELETAEEFGYTLSIEEIREIQKEEIHKITLQYLWAAVWVALFVAMNFIIFELIAAAHLDNIVGLKICAGILNYMSCIGFYHAIKLTFEGGE